jgi:hypothetical protein
MSRDPRYQQESFVPWVNLGETPVEMPLPVWNLDGVSWADAPPPPRRHQHWPQTTGVAGEYFERCPCGATWTRREGWYSWPQARVAEPRLPAWLDRLDEPAITGLYLAYVDLWSKLRVPFLRAQR